MNAEKLKKDIGRAAELAQSIHDDMVETFAADGVPSEIAMYALNVTGHIATLKWYLEHISEEVSA